jgi:hypothetical protein
VNARWLLIAAVGCGTRAPAPMVSNHAPSWKYDCAPRLERSVHADAHGVDRLVAPIDDALRTCWRIAVRIVDAGNPVVPPPSCRALRVSELRLSADWLASCRRFEAGSPPSRPTFAARSSPLLDPGLVVSVGLRPRLVDSDGDGIPDARDRCPDLAAAEGDVDGCPRRVRLQGFLPSHTPAIPPYDLTPAAQSICSAVADVVAHFATAPNPTIALALSQQWNADRTRYEIEWPVESTIAPVEDALNACLRDWTGDVTSANDGRRLRWQKGRFLVELRTSPERRLSIALE